MSILKEKRIFGVWLLFALVTFAAVWNHEPNRDEAQIWVMVRDLDPGQILQLLSSMGHPGLWYLILFPFAKLGFPYFSMLIIHWLIGITIAALVLFRSPFHPVFKVLFVFSYFMIFEYMVPARNYSLGILLLFLIADTYPARHRRPGLYSSLIFLLYSSNTLFFGAATALFLLFFIDCISKKKIPYNKFRFYSKVHYHLAFLMIMLCGAIVFLLQMGGPSYNTTVNPSFLPVFDLNSLWVSATAVQNAFLPVPAEEENLKAALLFCAFFSLFFLLLRKNPAAFTFLLVTSAWLLYVFITKFSGAWRHEGLFLIFLIFSLWIYERELEPAYPRSHFHLRKALMIALCVFFLFGIVKGAGSLRKEYLYAYSGAEEMAAFIRERPEQKEISCYPSYLATALTPYLPQTTFWFIDRNEHGTYYLMDSTLHLNEPYRAEEELINECVLRSEETYLLVPFRLYRLVGDHHTLRLLYFNRKHIWASREESYYLYLLRRY